MPKQRGICSRPDCDDPHFGRGLCYVHWRRWTRNGTFERLQGDHGETASPEYRVWVAMRRRCDHPDAVGYENYGARGITVCERWRQFAPFLADMGPRPSEAHTLERIDNNGSYSPENCRWATRFEQSRNKRTNVWLTLNGRTQIMQDWSRELGIPETTILYRRRRGLSDEECLSTNYRRRTKAVKS